MKVSRERSASRLALRRRQAAFEPLNYNELVHKSTPIRLLRPELCCAGEACEALLAVGVETLRPVFLTNDSRRRKP